MKRLLLKSSNIKPVNIRIVSNGIECADLKMLKENFCISDIKNVLDGRLVNWLSNIGEEELAENVKNKFSSPESILGKEIELYQLLGIIGKGVDIREYAKVLNNEKGHQIFLKEIKAIPNLILEIYQQFPDKYTIEEWIDFFQIVPTTEQVLDTLQNLEKLHEERIKQINEDSKNKFRDFLTFLIDYCETHYVYLEGDKAKQVVSEYLNSHITNNIYYNCGKSIIEGGLRSDGNIMAIDIGLKLNDNKEMESFNIDNFKRFLKSLLGLTEIPLVDSLQKKYVNKYVLAFWDRDHALELLDIIYYKWNEKTQAEKRNTINNYLTEKKLLQFYL